MEDRRANATLGVARGKGNALRNVQVDLVECLLNGWSTSPLDRPTAQPAMPFTTPGLFTEGLRPLRDELRKRRSR